MASKYSQQADGRYRTNVWDGTYINGRKHYVSIVSSKSSKDLEHKVLEYEMKREKGLIAITSDMTIQDYARQWLAAKKGLSETATKAMYSNIIEVHLKPFSSAPFSYFTSQNIQNIINDNSEKPRTCQQIVLTLKQIGKAAERDKLLPAGETDKIFYDIQVPKYKVEEKKPLTDEQCQAAYNAILTQDLPSRSRLFLAVIYFCGLRREEALALKIEDIHSLSISVNKALHLGEKGTEVKSTKTERGNRTVPLPQEAIPIIQELLKDITPTSEGFLFTTRSGELITKSAYRRMWDGIQKALGFECSAHLFRHTYCTRLCYEAYENRTISVKQIARLLGDTNKMVTDVYSHLVEEREQTNEALKSVFNVHETVNELSTNCQRTIGKNG